MTTKLPAGLYEQVVDEFTQEGIAEAEHENLRAQLRNLDPGDSHDYLSKHLAALIRTAFASLPAAEILNKQIDIANRIILLLAECTPSSIDAAKSRILHTELLLSLMHTPIGHPDTPLSISCLMTGTRQDPSLASQLQKEIASADSVDILCSFIKWGGIRILENSLKDLTATGRPLRVITTSYLGATDLKAIDLLCALPNTDLRISYDTRRTRLHAKAYIIKRNTGFGVAYIGSSNISNAALTDGLEWNVKISQKELPHLWDKICSTFNTYWNDAEFASYNAGDRERLRCALKQEHRQNDLDTVAVLFDIKPYPFQQEILDKLEAERLLHGRSRNLVVAATGTGKTLISAFDYARHCKRAESKTTPPARLLYVAHREEILKQSLGSFRAVLRDHNFGDYLVGGHEPASIDHLFISIQSFNSRELWNWIPPDYYSYVVIDEFHHAAAPSYQKLLDFIKPDVLLGLTATPERMDSIDILGHFGGHIATEIRLPDAINRKLLCPFQYFGISDSVNYSGLRWQRGGYVSEDLDNVLTGNDVRAQLIIEKTKELLLDFSQSCGLGFCVSIRHAEYMASVFNRAGIKSKALSANSPAEMRHSIQGQLIRKEINIIFAVDLYNEGVDIPAIDTILLLRPTESLTVFLQQIGRGLRLTDDKECLTVLDFIGQAHQNFNFEARFRALLGRSTHRIEHEMERGFPNLPAGCVISMERIAANNVLQNIGQAISHSKYRLLRRITTFESETGQTATLKKFIDYHNLTLDDIYSRSSWSRLLAEAGIISWGEEPDEERLTKGFRRIQHINGVKQISTLLSILLNANHFCNKEPEDELSRRYLAMLHFALWNRDWRPANLCESVSRLIANKTMHAELIELLRIKYDRSDEMPPTVDLPFFCPLELHAEYTRDEILSGLGLLSFANQPSVREGVYYAQSLPADLFFITLNKTEKDYSPTTMYEDYAINSELFHWQSQSTTSADSPTGKRYIHHREIGSAILFFVRENKRFNGIASPYTYLGPADYVSHEGSRPMSIICRLRHKLPARLLREIRRLASD